MQEIKGEALSRIAETTGPLTILLEGHGTRKGFYFSGDIDSTSLSGSFGQNRHITPEEFAGALNARYDRIQKGIKDGRLPEETAHEPVIMSYLSCYNSNQMRSMYEHLNPGVPKPIVIGGSEYGQLMFNNYDSEYHSKFLEGNILQLNGGGPATVGGAVEETLSDDPTYKESNPSIYIGDPDNPGIPMQIAQEHLLSEPIDSLA